MEEAGGIAYQEVGCYLRRNQAEERSLVLLAQRIPYQIVETERLYCLMVRLEHAEKATRELAAYEAERKEELRQKEREYHFRLPRFRKRDFASLILYIWLMIGFFVLQTEMPPEWAERGAASSSAILKGEGWRVFTALTLHGDSGHLVANLCVGLLFIAALLPLLGGGWTWLAILMSGGLGNLLNAWGYRGQEHHSVGATAIFGALGLVVAWQLVTVIRSARGSGRRPRWREGLVPLAAGLALLAFLGVDDGSEQSRVDVMAHLFGMLAGFGIGLVLAISRLPEHTSLKGQSLLLAAMLAILTFSWLLAYPL